MIKNKKAEFAGFMMVVMICLCLSANASEIKGKPLSAVEKLMRLDNNIMELDGMLNHSYRAAMRAVADRKKLKQEQISWLKTVRNVCKTTDCLEDVYCDRINELHDLEIKALGVIEKPLTDDEARDICRFVAKLADKGEISLMAVPGKNFSTLDESDKIAGWGLNAKELKKVVSFIEKEGGYVSNEPSHIFKLRLKSKSKQVLFGIFNGIGSCSSSYFYNLSNLKVLDESYTNNGIDVSTIIEDDKAEHYEGDDFEEDYDWDVIKYIIVYQGRYFIVTTKSKNNNRLTKIAWINYEGFERDLGLFRANDSHIAVISTINEALSSAVTRGIIKPLADYPLRIDIDGDGLIESIWLNIVDSGAGCGSTSQWFEIIHKDLEDKKKNHLNDLFNQFCRVNCPLEMYRFKGNHYIYGIVDDILGLFKIEKGKLVRACTLKQKTNTDFIRYYPFNPIKNQ